jgi:hypothetical protein
MRNRDDDARRLCRDENGSLEPAARDFPTAHRPREFSDEVLSRFCSDLLGENVEVVE